ncbi:MAG: hypothetical protein KDD82_30085, partial [Planctomycetes bacterium]|nr:hypothetical protein [Planctomycetota bacterium]
MRAAVTSRVACALLVAATWAQAQGRPTPASDARVEAFELNQATVADATRLLSELSGWNIAVTAEASAKTVTLHLSDVPARVALETLCKVAGLWFREADGVVRVMTAEEYQGDLEVKRDAQVRVYTLLHPNPEAVAVAIRDVFGPRVTLSLGYDTRFQGTQLLGGAGNGAAGVG